MLDHAAKNQLFFSYRRSDGTDNIKELKSSVEAGSGLNVFMDVDELRSGNFQEKLCAVIAESYAFVPVVTEDYIRFAFEGGRDPEGDFCLKEYREALLSGEIIVPIFVGTSGNGRKVSYDEAAAAAEALDERDPDALKKKLETIKAYLFCLNGVGTGSFADWNTEHSEKLAELVLKSFCHGSDVPYFKDYLRSRADELDPLTVFGDYADMHLTVRNSFVPLDLVRQLTEKEIEKRDSKITPAQVSCCELGRRINEDRLAVLVGDAGQGKSTIAKKLFIELAEKAAEFGLSESKLFPLFFECRQLKEDALSEKSAFIAELAEKAKLTPAALGTVTRYGQPLFILDALDEISPTHADKLLKAIYGYLRKDSVMPHILFTSRPGQKHVAGCGGMKVGNTEARRYTVNMLTEKQRNSYISVLAAAAHSGDEKERAFIRGLDRKESEVADYTELSRNPFLLFAVFEPFNKEDDLPDTHFDAVSRVIEDVIRRDLAKGNETLRADDIRFVLGALAYGIYMDRDEGKTPIAGAERAVNCAVDLFSLDSTDRDDRATINEYRSFFGRSHLFDRSGFRHEFLASAYAAYYLRFLINRKIRKGASPAECAELKPLNSGADYWKSVEKALLILLDRESTDSKEFVEPVIGKMQAAMPDYDTLCAAVGQFKLNQPRASALLLREMLDRGCRWIAAKRSPDDETAYPGEANPYEELFYYPAVFPYLRPYLETLVPKSEEDRAYYTENELIKEVRALFSKDSYEVLKELYCARKDCRYPELKKLLEKAAGERRGRNIKGYLRISEGIREIDEFLFNGCRGLTYMTISEGVCRIGWGAFFDCTGLTSVTIPRSVRAIDGNTFRGCIGLECLIVEKENEVFHSEGNCIINTAEKTLIIGCKTSIIPAHGSVEKISRGAFYGCAGLLEVDIPSGVKKIESEVFVRCTGLTNVTIPESVNSIGVLAFGGCEKLASVSIPTSVSEISSRTFCGCKGLSSVTIPQSVDTICTEAFADCFELTSVAVPPRVSRISGGAFARCRGLTSVAIPGSVRKVNPSVFIGCIGLKIVTISEGVREICSGAFFGCIGLKNVTIPKSVSVIELYAFHACLNLSVVRYAGTVEEWRKIEVKAGNEPLLYAKIIFNSKPD